MRVFRASVAGCAHAWNQPHPGRGRHPRLPPGRHVVHRRPGPDERHPARPGHLRLRHHPRVHLPRARVEHLRRPGRADASARSPSTAARLDPATAYVDSRIALDDLEATNTLVVAADCAYSNTGEGLHRFVDPADDRVYLYSQFEVPDARRVFTTFEQPDLKSVFTFNVTAPSHWVVVSNAATPEPGRGCATAPRCGASRPPSGCRPTSPRSWPASTTASSTPTRASSAPSRSATTAASRSRSTWTPPSWSS